MVLAAATGLMGFGGMRNGGNEIIDDGQDDNPAPQGALPVGVTLPVPLDPSGDLVPLPSAYALSIDEMDALVDKLDTSIPENSRRAIKSDMRYLNAWCEAATGHPLPWPAPEDLVWKYMLHHTGDMPGSVEKELIRRGVKRKAGAHVATTVERRLHSWKRVHEEIRNLPCVLSDDRVRSKVRSLIRGLEHVPDYKSPKPIDMEVLDRLLATCDGSLRGTRDRAMLHFAFDSGGRRRSEVTSLDRGQIRRQKPVPVDPDDSAAGTLPCYRIDMRRTKTTHGADRRWVELVGEPAQALSDWLEMSGIEEGAVFPNIDQWENVGDLPMTPDGFARMLKARLRQAGLDETLYSAHGIRAGFLTECSRNGVPLEEAMSMTLHKSHDMAIRYYNAAQVGRRGAARLRETRRLKAADKPEET